MDIKPGVYHVPNKDDWYYLVENLDFKKDYDQTDNYFKTFWDEHEENFCAHIRKGGYGYDFSYYNKDFYLNNEFEVEEYGRSQLIVELI